MAMPKLTDDQRLTLQYVYRTSRESGWKPVPTYFFYATQRVLAALLKRGLIAFPSEDRISLTDKGMAVSLRLVAALLNRAAAHHGVYVDHHPTVYRAFLFRFHDGRIEMQGFEDEWFPVDLKALSFREAASNHVIDC